MAGRLTLFLVGTRRLETQARSALEKWIRDGLSDVVASAGRELVIHTPQGKAPAQTSGSLSITLTFTLNKPPQSACAMVLGECGSGHIDITRHRMLSICGKNPKTAKHKVITTGEQLGHALANTSVHEVGHKVGGSDGAFADNRLETNFMNSGGAPRDARTADTQLAFFAGRLSWSEEQKKVLIANIKAGKFAFEDEFTVE